MRRRKYAYLIAIAVFVVAGSLSGCGSSTSGSASIEQNQVAKAPVTIAAKFPTADGAVKSLIPAGAQVIEVYAQKQPVIFTNYTSNSNYNPYGTLIATLTPTQQSATVQIVPGMYMIYAAAFNSANTASRTMVGQTSTGGEVKSGQANTIILSFLDGQWTIVNASDTAAPLVLSNGTQLNDFIVNADMQQQLYKAGKSSIDYTKPIGGGGGIVRLRFNNNTSARIQGGMVSQFVGTANSSILGSKSYNLTQKCGFDTYNGLPCDVDGVAGDQIVMISGKGDGGGSQSGGYYEVNILSGSAQTLLPNAGQTTFTQNGTAIDINTALPDTTITAGNLITGGIVEWKPTTSMTTTLGTPAVAKMAKISAKAVKAQSTNTVYANIVTKYDEIIVCSGTNPTNTGTWSFASNPDIGKVLIGGRTCYTNYPNVRSYDPITYSPVTPNAGDYSYGLVPAVSTNLGDYCHQWDTDMYLPYDPITNPNSTILNPYYNTRCKQQLPGAGDVYNPYNFRALKTASKTAISYGSFKFNFWAEKTQAGTAYIYPFRAKGSTTVTPAK